MYLPASHSSSLKYDASTCSTDQRRNAMSATESSASKVQVDQKNYQMPPQDGFTIAHFITVADIERSARFYETVFGGRVLSRGDRSGAPGYIQIANPRLIVNVRGGPSTATQPHH